MSTVTQPLKRGYRTLRLLINEADYERFMTENAFAEAQLDELYGRYPELFPVGFDQGYALYGVTDPSVRQGRRCRRVRLSTDTTVWTIAPAFVMPYMTAMVSEVEKALLLMRFHAPCWALAYVFGRDAMYWYPLQQSLGRFSVLGTTVKASEHLPQDLLADEKHSRLDGEKIYLATTAGEGCILGASVSDSASEAALTQAYDGVFAEEARELDGLCARDRQHGRLGRHTGSVEALVSAEGIQPARRLPSIGNAIAVGIGAASPGKWSGL